LNGFLYSPRQASKLLVVLRLEELPVRGVAGAGVGVGRDDRVVVAVARRCHGFSRVFRESNFTLF